ncbi:MAG: hypothetical protein O3B24_01985 [Verrucomicrobia bacterium]|nr:hypothetical protein [Verrucomicrobiota bacterium]
MDDKGLTAESDATDRMRQVETLVTEYEKPLLRYALRLLRVGAGLKPTVGNWLFGGHPRLAFAAGILLVVVGALDDSSGGRVSARK